MPLRYVVLGSSSGWHYQDLCRASAHLDCELVAESFRSLEVILGGGTKTRFRAGTTILNDADGLLVRMMPPGTLEQVVFRMDVLQRLEADEVPVLNPPRAIEAAVDKYLALAILDAAGLPVPLTSVTESAERALNSFEALGRNLAIKPLFGSEGRGLIQVSDPDLAFRAFWTIERLNAVLYLQEMIDHDGHDLRLFVIGDQVVGAIRREAPEGDWRTNIARGGNAEAILPSEEASRLAVAATKAVGALIAGVDLALDRRTGGFVILEVNAAPGWRALAEVTKVDIALMILDQLRSMKL